ncbi:MAG: CPBP family intramembrane glutamic endopeptidase [Pseudomonadota bacterium]
MDTGPYNTPLALRREPLTATFFVLAGWVVISTVVVMVIAAVSPGLFGSRESGINHGALAIASCLAALAFFALVSAWSEWIGAGPFAGSMRAPPALILVAMLVSPAIAMMITLGVGAVAGGGAWIYPDEETAELYSEVNRTLASYGFILLLAPVWEEVVYRGIGMGGLLVRRVPGPLAVIVTSLAFTLTHFQYTIWAMAVVFLIGCWLGFLRLWSGTLIVPIAAHFAINLASVLL